MKPKPQAPDLRTHVHVIGEHTRELLVGASLCPPFHGRHIQLAGVSWASEEFRFQRPDPGIMQVLICVKGEGRVWLDGAWRSCRAGQGCLTPAHVPHAYHAQRGWQVVWAILYPAADLTFPERVEMRDMNPEPLLHIVHGLHSEASGGADKAALGHWTELLWHALANRVEMPPSRLWRLWRQVRESPGEAWTLKRLARLAGMSEENLRLVCRRELGRSPVEHLTRLRMQHATSLLRMGQKVEFVARCVGYESPHAFSTAFKRITGHSPREARDSGSGQ